MDNQLEIQDPVGIIPDPGPRANIGPGHSYESVSKRIAGVVYLPFNKSPRKWLIGVFIAFCFVNLLTFCVWTLFVRGTGIWGINIPIGWGFAIINFVVGGSVSATPAR